MKKILLAGIISAAMITCARAQNSNNICVFNHMDVYNGGGGPDELEQGMKCSDEAIQNENTANVSKTWFYRGQLFTLVFTDTILQKKYLTSAFEAVKAFSKLQALNEPKFKDWDEVFRYLEPLEVSMFNVAVDLNRNKNYAQAYKFFYTIKDIDTIYSWKKKKPRVDLLLALDYAGKSAQSAGDTADQIKVYKEIVDIHPSDTAYLNYAITLRNAGKTDELSKVLDEALAKYPKNGGLLNEKINMFLQAGKPTEAINYINRAIEAQPQNDMLWFVKGLAYEKTNDDSLLYCYHKAVEINPKNFKAQYNLGAYYYNKATKVREEMNKLGNSEAELKKYNELKQQSKEYFQQAKPYFDKAQAIDATDQQTIRALNQIKMYTGE